MFSQPAPTAGSQPHHEDCMCAACGGDPWEGTWGPGDNAPAIHRTVLGATADAPAAAGSPAMDDTLTPDPPRLDTDLPAELIGWYELAAKASEHEKGWKDVKDAAVQKIKTFMEERGLDEVTVAGRTVATWRESKPADHFDAKALKADHPDIYARYLTAKKPARPFKLTGD